MRFRAYGVTLVELLITTVIASIAMMALAIPLIAERSFWGTGKRQTEAQRDAQLAMRAIARVGREAWEFDVVSVNPNQSVLKFKNSGASCEKTFIGDRINWKLYFLDACAGTSTELINGERSRLKEMFVEGIGARQVRIRLRVAHSLRANDPREEDEVLETQLYLRNASGS